MSMMMPNEKTALVLELGARYLKAGLSEERAPRCVLRWSMAERLSTAAASSRTDWAAFFSPVLHHVCFEYESRTWSFAM